MRATIIIDIVFDEKGTPNVPDKLFDRLSTTAINQGIFFLSTSESSVDNTILKINENP